jgi:hypothetical protein
MYHAHKVFLDGHETHEREIYVMDFIFHEMYHTILEKKRPIYAPYVMKLVHAKNTLSPIIVLVPHNLCHLQVKKTHVVEVSPPPPAN